MLLKLGKFQDVAVCDMPLGFAVQWGGGEVGNPTGLAHPSLNLNSFYIQVTDPQKTIVFSG